MKFLLIFTICVALCVGIMQCEPLPGRGGSGRSSGGSRSRGSSGSSGSSKSSSGGVFGGWFGSSSGSSPAKTYGSSSGSNYGSSSNNVPKASAPASNTGTNYGWNVNGQNGGIQNQANAGSNAGNTQYGWNVGQGAQKPSAPVGPPPSYPGLGHNPVASHNQPPAYSPSHVYPPAYSPSHVNPPAYGSATNTQYRPQNNQFGQSQYNNNNQQFGQTQYNRNNQYGSPGYSNFGGQPAVVNNYYGSQQSRGGFGSSLMTNAMFYGIGMHHGHSWGSNSGRRWSDDEDRRWRSTTKAPYFENKVPGSENIMPAAAVLGAASVFGLASLLPLRVPIGKPLLSCNETYLNQTDVRLDGKLYECENGTILVSCLEVDMEQTINSENITTQILSSENVSTSSKNTTICKRETFTCEFIGNDPTACSNATLSFQQDIFCNSTMYVNERNATELHCFFGTLDESQKDVYIPTANPLDSTTSRITTTESPPFTTKIANFVYGYILWGMGKSDQMIKQTTTEKPIENLPVILENSLEDIKNYTKPVMQSLEQNILEELPPTVIEQKSAAMTMNDTIISEEEKIVQSNIIIEQKLAEIQNFEADLDSSDDLKKMSKIFKKSD